MNNVIITVALATLLGLVLTLIHYTRQRRYRAEYEAYMATHYPNGFEFAEVHLPTVTIGPEDLDITKDIKE